tara:strand:- start:42033 stop:43250 length:1218 start_codon:yes stop_codon:yes gene_type:complete
MSASNRAKLIGKLHTALKKNYTGPSAQPTRPLLEHLLYACLLEDAPFDLADESLAKCEQDFFDWNEVRVTTVTELSQVFSRLPDPMKAARRLKSNLQSVFETFYTFDLDHLKKDNLGKAVGKFEKMPAMSPFVLSYTVQHGLGGHSIPIDYSAMVIMLATGIVTQAEAMDGRVPGIERAIPKSKGIEFSELLHTAAVALSQDIKDKKARALLNSVDKDSSERLDEWLASKKAAKRRAAKQKVEAKKAAEAAALAAIEAAKNAPEPVKKTAGKKSAPKKEVLSAAEQAKQTAAKVEAAKKREVAKAKKEAAAKKKTTTKKVASSKKAATKTTTAKTTTTKKATPTKKSAKSSSTASKSTKSKTTKSKSTKAPTKKPAAKKTPAKATKKKASTKKSPTRKLSKRKPR